MKEFLEENLSIRTNDADLNNRLKMNSIFIYLQDNAAAHADKLHLGYGDLLAKELGWVLSWVRVEVEKYPQYSNNIKIMTWPKCKYKLYSMRDFLIYDKNNIAIIKATTAWLPVNIKTKRIVDLQSLNINIPYQPEESALEIYPEKIISNEEKHVVEKKIFKYSDLDLNQHVNNTKYVELILNCFTKEFHSQFIIKNFTISFQTESFYDDEIEISHSKSSENKMVDIVEAKNELSGKSVFQSLIEWEKSS